MKLTITEALAEKKTLKSRLQKRRQALLQYLARDSQLRDPFEKDGGTAEWIRRERQAIGDLETRLYKICSAVQKSNLETMLTIETQSRSVADWLNWRREVSAERGAHLMSINATVQKIRMTVAQQQKAAVSSLAVQQEAPSAPTVFINIDESLLQREIDEHEKLIGTLDGRLSLNNATQVIELPD